MLLNILIGIIIYAIIGVIAYYLLGLGEDIRGGDADMIRFAMALIWPVTLIQLIFILLGFNNEG